MKKFIIFFFLFTILDSSAQTSPVKSIVDKMILANNGLHTAKFTMHGEERLRNGKFAITERLVKMNVYPKQIYFYSVTPDPGTEILWESGKDDNKMLVSPGGFPYVTFSLHYASTLARKDSHHPIDDLGFDYAIKMIEYYVKSYGNELYNQISILDTVKWDNRMCIHVSLEYKKFNTFNYTLKPGENVTDVAKKYYVNDYLVLTMNPSISNYDDVKPGQVIRVPNFYCNKIEFYIDKLTWLPVRQIISDQKGVYEKYEFKSLMVNPNFKPDEFTRDYKDYKF